MTSIRPGGYCKECGGYTQAVYFDTSRLCAACSYKKEKGLKEKVYGRTDDLENPDCSSNWLQQ